VRLTTVRVDGGTVAARLEGSDLIPLNHSDVGALLRSEGGLAQAATGGGEPIPLESAELATLIPDPEKIFCAGLNYRLHAEEAGLPIPDYPVLFSKYSRTLIGPNDPLVLPSNSDKVDWEAELCIVIGKDCRLAGPEEAS